MFAGKFLLFLCMSENFPHKNFGKQDVNLHPLMWDGVHEVEEKFKIALIAPFWFGNLEGKREGRMTKGDSRCFWRWLGAPHHTCNILFLFRTV